MDKKNTSKKPSSKTATKPSSKTSTATKTATSTKTSTDAYTQGNITVTGGAGKGETKVNISVPRGTDAKSTKAAKKSQVKGK